MLVTIDLIDEDDQILVKKGDTVDFTTPLAKKQGSTPVTIYLAQELGIAPKDIFIALKKVVGDTIAKGDVIASKKTLLATKVLESPYEGVLKEVNHDDGTIIVDIKEAGELEIKGFFKGEITEVKGSSITFKVKGGKEYPLAGATASFGGEMVVGKVDDLSYLTQAEVDGKVVVAGNIKPHEQVKVEALGATGVVTAYDPKRSLDGKVAQLKKEVSLKDLATSSYPYCIINKKSGTLYLYN